MRVFLRRKWRWLMCGEVGDEAEGVDDLVVPEGNVFELCSQ